MPNLVPFSGLFANQFHEFLDLLACSSIVSPVPLFLRCAVHADTLRSMILRRTHRACPFLIVAADKPHSK